MSFDFHLDYFRFPGEKKVRKILSTILPSLKRGGLVLLFYFYKSSSLFTNDETKAQSSKATQKHIVWRWWRSEFCACPKITPWVPRPPWASSILTRWQTPCVSPARSYIPAHCTWGVYSSRHFPFNCIRWQTKWKHLLLKSSLTSVFLKPFVRYDLTLLHFRQTSPLPNRHLICYRYTCLCMVESSMCLLPELHFLYYRYSKRRK